MTLLENSWNLDLVDIFVEFYNGPEKIPGIFYDP